MPPTLSARVGHDDEADEYDDASLLLRKKKRADLENEQLMSARVWYNRRVEMDLYQMIETTLKPIIASQTPPPPATATTTTNNNKCSLSALRQHREAFGSLLCGERFVISFAAVPAGVLPPHLDFVRSLTWVQTRNHSITTLAPSYSAVDPRDGQTYTIYDHVIMQTPEQKRRQQQQHPEDDDDDTYGGGGVGVAHNPYFPASVWLLARDTQDERVLSPSSLKRHARQRLHHQDSSAAAAASDASAAREAATTHTTTCHMNVLLCGYKFGTSSPGPLREAQAAGAAAAATTQNTPLIRQDHAPGCPLCPWACPCLVDEWYDETTGLRVDDERLRLSHICARVDDLIDAADRNAFMRQLPPSTKAIAPVTRSIMRREARRLFISTFSDGSMGQRALPPTITTIQEREEDARSDQQKHPPHQHDPNTAAACNLNGWTGLDDTERLIVLSGFTDYHVDNDNDSPAAAVYTPRIAPTMVVVPSIQTKPDWAISKRGAIIAHFHDFVRFSLNDQLVRLLVRPYAERTEPCFHLPPTFIDDIFDPVRRPSVLHLLHLRARLPFPECITTSQQQELAFAAKRNAAFLRVQRRPPYLLLLTDAQLNRCCGVKQASSSSTAAAAAAASTAAAVAAARADNEDEPINHNNNSGTTTTTTTEAHEEAVVVVPMSMTTTTTTTTPTAALPMAAVVGVMDDDPPVAAPHHRRTKTQRKATRRARLLLEKEHADLVEALRLSILENEEAAVREVEAQRQAFERAAQEAAAREAAASLARMLQDVDEAMRRLLLHHPTEHHAVVARAVCADQTLWAPLHTQALEFPDDARSPIDAACTLCFETFDLEARFPLVVAAPTQLCHRSDTLLLCNPCFLELRDRHRAVIKQRRDPINHNNDDDNKEDGEDIDRRFPLPVCVCSADHAFAPDGWRMATQWVGRRWAAAHFGYI